MLIVRTMILLAAAAPVSGPPAADPLGGLLSLPAVKAALSDADARRESFVQEWIRIAEIPAPSGGEARRAAYLQRRFEQLGLDPVTRDAAGNVIGMMKGSEPSLKKVAFCAHLDTVAPAGADHSVLRLPGGDGGILKAPGVRDDASGLAALLAAVSLMRAHRLTPRADTWFVASVQEESGLHGAERFVSDNAGHLGAFVAVDGHLGQISYAASGIVWLKLRFAGEAAHTLKAHEKSSALLAAARAIEAISAIPLRRSPQAMESWLNIGSMGAGDVPNALPRDAWITVDIRSNDPDGVRALESRVLDAAGRVARNLGVKLETETLHRLAGGSLPGAERSPLVTSARQVLESLSWRPIDLTPRGTADHNVAIGRGIPGIAIGITTGDGAHTPDEYADIRPFSTGVRQILLLALLPLTGA